MQEKCRARSGNLCEKKVRDREKGSEERERELVEARCTPQSRPGCLVARSNQT